MASQDSSTILLVDDNPAHRRLVKRALSKAGLPHRIIEADSLRTAGEILTGATPLLPAAAIIDLNLSDGRGTALVAQLRGVGALKAMPIIVLSTSSLISDMRDSYDHGADCYLIKSDEAMSIGVARGIRFLLRWP